LPRKKYAHGTVLDIDVTGVTVTYEGKSSKLFRIQLDGGITMFGEDPHDLNRYFPDGIQYHRTNKVPQRGTAESQEFCSSLVWTGDVVSLQLVGPRTILVYTESSSKTRNASTCALLAVRMLEKAQCLTPNP
jgi:hypothetical protein